MVKWPFGTVFDHSIRTDCLHIDCLLIGRERVFTGRLGGAGIHDSIVYPIALDNLFAISAYPTTCPQPVATVKTFLLSFPGSNVCAVDGARYRHDTST